MDQQENLLKDLGKNLGLNLNFDEHGQCLFFLDKKIIVSIKKQPDSFLFYGMLNYISEQKDCKFFEKILSLNLSLAELDKGTIVLDPKTNVIMLVKAMECKINSFELEKKLGDFVSSVESLIRIIKEISINSNDDDDDDKSDFLNFA